MANIYLSPVDFTGNELLNTRLQNLAAAPAHSAGRMYYDTVLGYARISTGSEWIDLVQGGLDTEAVRDTVASQFAAGTHTNITVTNNDAGDSISLSVAADGAAGTATLRTLGTGATQAAAGNDARLSDARTPLAHTHGSTDITDFTTAVDARVANVIDAAPETLNTLNELAAALGDDPNFATTVTTQIAAKVGKYSETIGDGATTTYTITHNLNTKDVTYSLRYAANDKFVDADVTAATVNTLTVVFGVAPAASSIRVVVHG